MELKCTHDRVNQSQIVEFLKLRRRVLEFELAEVNATLEFFLSGTELTGGNTFDESERVVKLKTGKSNGAKKEDSPQEDPDPEPVTDEELAEDPAEEKFTQETRDEVEAPPYTPPPQKDPPKEENPINRKQRRRRGANLRPKTKYKHSTFVGGKKPIMFQIRRNGFTKSKSFTEEEQHLGAQWIVEQLPEYNSIEELLKTE